jgi:hypothetical protein
MWIGGNRRMRARQFSKSQFCAVDWQDPEIFEIEGSLRLRQPLLECTLASNWQALDVGEVLSQTSSLPLVRVKQLIARLS